MSCPPESVVVAGPQVNAGCRVQPPRHRGGEAELNRRNRAGSQAQAMSRLCKGPVA